MTNISTIFQVSIDKGKDDKVYYGHAEIVKLLNQQKNLTPEDNELFKENLYKIISDESKSIQNLDHMKMLMRVLYDLRQMEELLKHCFKMSALFSENSYPLEWICKGGLISKGIDYSVKSSIRLGTIQILRQKKSLWVGGSRKQFI